MNKPRSWSRRRTIEKDREDRLREIPSGLPWMSPVGRLDKASEGLLLFTNVRSGRRRSPAGSTWKNYHVQINALASEELLRTLQHGVIAAEGEVLRVKRARRIREGEKNSGSNSYLMRQEPADSANAGSFGSRVFCG